MAAVAATQVPRLAFAGNTGEAGPELIGGVQVKISPLFSSELIRDVRKQAGLVAMDTVRRNALINTRSRR